MASRTPLLRALRDALRIASRSRTSGIPIDDVYGSNSPTIDRRTFLKGAGATALVATTGGIISSCGPSILKATDARVAIVGAGLAGLTAAYDLKKAGITAQIYEASTRMGGRVFTARDIMGSGFTTELGGEFIDSSHEELLALARELEIGILDRHANPLLKEHTYFFGGEHKSDLDAATAFVPAVQKIHEDFASLPEAINYRTRGTAAVLDAMPLSSYIAQLPVEDWLKQALSVAYLTEFGLETASQSSLNLVTTLGPATSENHFHIFGESDERFRIDGGNSVITRELASRLEQQIHSGMVLEAIEAKGSGFDLTFAKDATANTIRADAVILALPFTMLRNVAIDVELPPLKRKAIDELGYGTHTKLMIGMKRRVWNREDHSGYAFSDRPFQLGWDNTELQPGENGGYTALLAGTTGLEANKPTQHELADRMLPGLSECFPGFSHWTNNKYERFHWPSYPFTKGSYACYLPGQWTSIAGAEIEPVGNLFFAGEHTSQKAQGFMNGAVETGQYAARSVLSLVKS